VIPLRDANPTRRTPVITLAIIAACVVVYGYQVLLLAQGGDDALDAFITRWGVVPAELVDALRSGAFASMETVTLVTSQFLHGSLVHIAGNMLFLWIFGNNIEDRFGRLAFLAFYLVGGVVAGLTQVVIDPTSTVPTIGASGAIAAVLGAYLVLFPGARVTTAIFLIFFYQLIEIPAIFVLGFWFACSSSMASARSARWARRRRAGSPSSPHIGGFIFGAADRAARSRRRRASRRRTVG
jgi:membrane associated rhomboid family serine protease